MKKYQVKCFTGEKFTIDSFFNSENDALLYARNFVETNPMKEAHIYDSNFHYGIFIYRAKYHSAPLSELKEALLKVNFRDNP